MSKPIPASSFLATLKVNLDNKKLSDADFREMVRNTLPAVDSIDWAERAARLRQLQQDLTLSKDAFDRAWDELTSLERQETTTALESQRHKG